MDSTMSTKCQLHGIVSVFDTRDQSTWSVPSELQTRRAVFSSLFLHKIFHVFSCVERVHSYLQNSAVHICVLCDIAIEGAVISVSKQRTCGIYVCAKASRTFEMSIVHATSSVYAREIVEI